MKRDNAFRYGSLSLLFVWLLLFAVLPFSLVILASFLSHSSTALLSQPLTLQSYANLSHTIYWKIFEQSFVIAGAATLCCLILGYPFAYTIARMESRFKNTLMLLVIIPFWTSSLIRSYALIAIIKAKGILNMLLLHLGIIHQPLPILFSNTAVLIGLIYNLLPFMILPLMTNIERLDHRLIDAAYDLGASRSTTFRRIIIPLTMPGILAGSILVFLPAMTLFYIPDILGGAKSILIGNLIQNQFIVAENWPMGSMFSVILTAVLATLLLLHKALTRDNKKQEWL